jgi:hypothetical protein
MGGAMDGGRFDVARAVARGCRLAWAGRGLVARVAAPALAANLLCLAAAGALGASLEVDPLRTTLIFLPAFFAEGWAAATLARLAVLGPGAALARTREGLRARTAGMVAYVLAALGWGAVLALALPVQARMEGAEPSAWAAAAVIVGLAGGLWALRLGWAFVPAALGAPLALYLARVRGWGFSLRLLAVMVACAAGPLLAAFLALGLLAALGLAGPDAVVVGYALAAAMEVAVVVVSTLAVAAGVDEVFRGADAR